jgi:hypothetical protein
MSENKKFTTEELEKITALRDENQVKVGEFGQIELEILANSSDIYKKIDNKRGAL